jgi:hypothetical protein
VSLPRVTPMPLARFDTPFEHLEVRLTVGFRLFVFARGLREFHFMRPAS